jgi:hypothetical protein
MWDILGEGTINKGIICGLGGLGLYLLDLGLGFFYLFILFIYFLFFYLLFIYLLCCAGDKLQVLMAPPGGGGHSEKIWVLRRVTTF